ncbi:MAG TPA: PhoU domain-containing protein, partial [Pseudonocardia sp.]|nr:PhoU domain-containing protein [Pseudonocardia sp.]
MREVFQRELAQLRANLTLMCALVGESMQRATQALLETDLHLSEQVISADDDVDRLSTRCEEQTFSLLALQAPVAGDLRVVAALLQVIKNIERMGDQCVNIAKLIPLSGHEPPVQDEIM